MKLLKKYWYIVLPGGLVICAWIWWKNRGAAPKSSDGTAGASTPIQSAATLTPAQLATNHDPNANGQYYPGGVFLG